MLSSGALVIRLFFLTPLGQYAFPSGGSRNGSWLAEGLPGTLLGPEEAAAFWGRLLERPGLAWRGCAWWALVPSVS
jgi:hypothetical protein